MQLEQVKAVVGDTPDMSFKQAQKISGFLLDHKLQEVLELGFCHGVSTCYMAATLEEMRSGHITTIDLEVVRHKNPNIGQLLSKCGLAEYVDVFFEPTSYTWRLMKFLEEDPSPRYDVCYLDGAHNWFVDGFAFFLVDRLLRLGGWIIFDDLDWTYAQSPTLRTSQQVQNMPADERVTPQVRKVYELLVRPHPHYSDFRIEDGWVYAHKVGSASSAATREFVREVVIQKEKIGLGSLMLRAYRKWGECLSRKS